MYNKTKQIFVASLVALTLVGMSCSNKGDGDSNGESSPVAVTFKTVVTRGESSYAISTDGKLYTWGKNDIGQLGDGTTDHHNTPKQIMAGTAFQTVVAGGSNVGISQTSIYAISTDGKLYAWGDNSSGQLGDGTTDQRNTPTEIMAGIKTVVAGSYHTLAISTDNKLYAWGYNYNGQLGNSKSGLGKNESTPQLIEVTGKTFKTVVANGDNSFAISTDGKLYAWGKNGNGQLGNNSTTDSSTPEEIMAGIKTVVANGNSSFAISTDDKLYAWGSNSSGQLGNGKSGFGKDKVTPQEITVTGKTFETVVAGEKRTLAISTDNKLYAWGSNSSGQLGNGKAGSKELAPQEIEVTGIKTIVAGNNHALAINTDGKLYVWGDNQNGQLGNGKAGYDENYNREKEVTPQLIKVYE